MSLHLYIERLVLDGLPAEMTDTVTFQAVVESRLAQLFLEKPAALSQRSSSSLQRITGAEIHLDPTFEAPIAGREIAKAIHSAVSSVSLFGLRANRAHQRNAAINPKATTPNLKQTRSTHE